MDVWGIPSVDKDSVPHLDQFRIVRATVEQLFTGTFAFSQYWSEQQILRIQIPGFPMRGHLVQYSYIRGIQLIPYETGCSLILARRQQFTQSMVRFQKPHLVECWFFASSQHNVSKSRLPLMGKSLSRFGIFHCSSVKLFVDITARSGLPRTTSLQLHHLKKRRFATGRVFAIVLIAFNPWLRLRTLACIVVLDFLQDRTFLIVLKNKGTCDKQFGFLHIEYYVSYILSGTCLLQNRRYTSVVTDCVMQTGAAELKVNKKWTSDRIEQVSLTISCASNKSLSRFTRYRKKWGRSWITDKCSKVLLCLSKIWPSWSWDKFLKLDRFPTFKLINKSR